MYESMFSGKWIYVLLYRDRACTAQENWHQVYILSTSFCTVRASLAPSQILGFQYYYSHNYNKSDICFMHEIIPVTAWTPYGCKAAHSDMCALMQSCRWSVCTLCKSNILMHTFASVVTHVKMTLTFCRVLNACCFSALLQSGSMLSLPNSFSNVGATCCTSVWSEFFESSLLESTATGRVRRGIDTHSRE